MHFFLELRLDAYHRPTEKWHCHKTTFGLRAVSRKHAINKGLKVVQSWPGYTDRVNHADWTVTAEAAIVEVTQ